jgi:NAD+ synthase
MMFNEDILRIDCEAEVERICDFIRQHVEKWNRDGIVIGLSGGVDSALCAMLCVQAIGRDKVLGLILPERESNAISKEYALAYAQKIGLNTTTIDITPTLEGFGTYEKRDEAIKVIFPEYNQQYKAKIYLPADLLSRDALNFFTLEIQDADGGTKSSRLDKQNMLRIIAATDTKQRTRMMHLYYQAERINFLVCGTTNRTETIQGFFVKYGDGGTDIEPIAHLYKMQVYQLANHLGVIKEILERAPSPDTFSLELTDEQFYFRIPYHKLDLLLYAWENNINIAEVCEAMNLTEEQVKRAFRDFTAKYNTSKYLRMYPPTLTH